VISDLSKTLNLSNEDGEKWIVNLIRDSRMGVDAKIDLKSVSERAPARSARTSADDCQNMLHITRPHTTPTATLIETTRGLAFRSQAIQYAMQSSESQPRTGGERGERGERMSIWPPFPRPDTNGLATAVNKRGVERVRRVDSGERDGKVVQNGRGRRWWEWYVWMEKDENADET
jgi:hypothetical protein